MCFNFLDEAARNEHWGEREEVLFLFFFYLILGHNQVYREREVGSGLEVGAWLDGGEPSHIYRTILLRIRPYVTLVKM